MDRALWQDRRGERQTSVETVASIEGAHLLLERFGSWPTFEDFEIISLHFDRGNAMDIFQTKAWSNLKEPSIVVALYGFDIRYSSTDAERKPTVINIRFQGSFERVALDGFNHQNPICGMEITISRKTCLPSIGAGRASTMTCRSRASELRFWRSSHFERPPYGAGRMGSAWRLRQISFELSHPW